MVNAIYTKTQDVPSLLKKRLLIFINKYIHYYIHTLFC